jgi:hypothetical protein
VRFEYEVNRGEFSFEWVKPSFSAISHSSSHSSVSKPPLDGHPTITSNVTEIFLPLQLVKGKKFVVAVDGAAQGSKWWYDANVQTLFVEQPDPADIPDGAKYKLIFGLTPPPAPKWPLKTHWEDFALYHSSFLATLIALLLYIYL